MNELSKTINEIQILIINEFINFLIPLSRTDWQLIISAIPPTLIFLFYCLNIKEDDYPLTQKFKKCIDLLLLLFVALIFCFIVLVYKLKPSVIESFVIPLFKSVLINTYLLSIASTLSCVSLYIFYFRVIQPRINKIKLWFKKKSQTELNTPHFKSVSKELKTRVVIDQPATKSVIIKQKLYDTT